MFGCACIWLGVSMLCVCVFDCVVVSLCLWLVVCSFGCVVVCVVVCVCVWLCGRFFVSVGICACVLCRLCV